MEDRYQHTINGQSVLQADLNVLGESSGLADDRVFAELLRLAPYDGTNVSRGILSYAHQSSGADGLIKPNGASGSVLVNPFRAFVGSRTAVATDAKKNWRDIRSAVGVGSTTLAQVKSFSANSSGNPRWDLVYAAVAVDTTTASVSRKKKDPATKVISDVSVVTRLSTTVTVAVQAGTPAASPTPPAAPSDAGGVYYIPLAYVRIPNGFGASSTVLKTDIAIIAPCVTVAPPGGSSLQIADQHYKVGGSILSNAAMQSWGASGTRPEAHLPSMMAGSQSLICAFNLISGQETLANDAVIDSRDWRGRFAKFKMVFSNDIVDPVAFAWMGNGSQVLTPSVIAQNFKEAGTPIQAADGIGQTFVAENYAPGIFPTTGTGKAFVALAGGNADSLGMPSGALVGIYCDLVDGGKLKVSYTTSPHPAARFFCWIDFTGAMGPAV